MKNLKTLLLAVILMCGVGVLQTKAQAYIERGSEYKPLIYEIDGEQYSATAYVEYQYEGTPSRNFNWVSHGRLIEASKSDGQGGWIALNYIPLPKRTIKAVDPRGFDEKVKITPTGKVTVSAHVKDIAPWW